MLNKIIEGRYNVYNTPRFKYKRTHYRTIFVLNDKDGKFVGFEASEFAEIESAISDAVRYLKSKHIDEEYILKFNSKRIKVNANCNINLTVEEYLKAYENAIYSLGK